MGPSEGAELRAEIKNLEAHLDRHNERLVQELMRGRVGVERCFASLERRLEAFEHRQASTEERLSHLENGIRDVIHMLKNGSQRTGWSRSDNGEAQKVRRRE